MRAFWRQFARISARLALITIIVVAGSGNVNHPTKVLGFVGDGWEMPDSPTDARQLAITDRPNLLPDPRTSRIHSQPSTLPHIPQGPRLAPTPLTNIAKIATGSQHTCAVTTNGAVQCWGRNALGQLGNNDPSDSGAPVDVSGLSSGVAAVSAGYEHTCALTSTGAVKCWGYNVYGQLGNNSTFSSSVPVDVAGLGSGVTSISAGAYHTCARTNAGIAKCWGYNAYGQLGNNSILSSSVPVNVTGLVGGVSTISAGYFHSCALNSTGALRCWGYNAYGQLGNNTTDLSQVPVDVVGLGSNTSEVTAGGYHTCARTSAGGLKCWGYNNAGQLGNNSIANSSVPADVIGLNSGVATVSAGGYSVCAVLSTGALKCWGTNNVGQLGNNSTTNSSTPVDAIGLSSGVSVVDVGDNHACAVMITGTAKCWGFNQVGQLGNGWPGDSSLPVGVSGLTSGVSAITTKNRHACALTSSGAGKCWGYNFYGQLGDGTNINAPNPVDVTLGNNLSSLVVGGFHTCGIVIGGGPSCWGRNTEGQLGNGITATSLSPVDVIGLNSDTVALAAGWYHNCAIVAGGGVKCWGYNAHGGLGNNGTTNSPTPINVDGLGSGVSALALGLFHSCALTTNGAVKCWGYNFYGQLGNNSNANSGSPVDVIGLSGGVSAITAGYNNTCALTNTGVVKCWGENLRSQLGTTAIISSSVPIDINGLTGSVSALATGSYHACGRTTNSTTQCWGLNSSGQLGASNVLSSPLPLTVPGLGNNANALSAGNAHTCALLSSGAVRCWGDGGTGQLGDGNAWKTTPVDVVSSAIPPSGPSQLSLPLLTAGYPVFFEGPAEQEPNNTPDTANSPIRLNATYTGRANDQSDYFRFDLPQSRTIVITLNGHAAQDAKCNGQPCLQLHLRDAVNTLLVYDFQKPYQIISPSLPAGQYYVRIFDASDGANNTGSDYALSVTTQ